MKHFAQINTEFVKEARKWDDLSYDEQRGYLKRHPKSKRKITAKPEQAKPVPTKQDGLTNVQQKLLDACEPLIIDLQDKTIAHFDRVLEDFEKKKKAAPKDMSWRSFRHAYTTDQNVLYLVSYVYEQKKGYLSTIDNYELNEDRKNKYYENTKDSIREGTTYKLSRVLNKYITSDFKKVSDVDVEHGAQGFDIFANLVDDQGRPWTFKARAIGAGGYNIQEWHYRYIVNLSSPEVPKEIVRRKISDQEKAEKEERRQQRADARTEKQRMRGVKDVVAVFAEIKRRVKDWDEWERSSLAQGGRTDEIEKRLPKVERLREFINRYNMKRNELKQKIIDKEITFDDFSEVDDILSGDQYFFDYNRLKRRLVQ